MNTSFLTTTIERIARRKMALYFLCLLVISTSTCGFLIFLWLIDMTDAGFYFVTIGGALFICAIIVRSMRMLNHVLENPLASYFVDTLKYYGPPEQTIAQIDAEAAPYLGTTGSFVTKHWIISAQSNFLGFTRLEDVVWIYKQLSESSVRFYFAFTVSTGKTYAAKIWNRSGFCTTILSSDEGVNRLLETIGKNAPWVSKGYMDYLAGAWQRN